MGWPKGRKRGRTSSARRSISKRTPSPTTAEGITNVTEPSIQDEIQLASSPPGDEIVDETNTDNQPEEEEEPQDEEDEDDEEDKEEEDDEEEDEDEEEAEGETISVELASRTRGRTTRTPTTPQGLPSRQPRPRGRPAKRGRLQASTPLTPEPRRTSDRSGKRGRGRPPRRAGVHSSRENSEVVGASPASPEEEDEEDEEEDEVIEAEEVTNMSPIGACADGQDIIVKPRGRGGNTRQRPRGPVGTVIFDAKGNPQEILNDEALLTETDPDGEQKVDLNGNLLGGREYRCRTFTVLNRGLRLYMLSTEPARALGFRDSYLFFRNNPVLYKILATDAEKTDMIERGIMPPSYKGRTVGLVTARSVFKQYGAKIVVGGRRVIDDYWEAKVRADPDIVEGELADPTDILPKEGEPYNRDRYVAWMGASAVYHTQPASTIPTQPTLLGGRAPKRKVHVTDENWISEHAWACQHFNADLTTQRRERFSQGYYEPHLDLRFFSCTTQPTMAKWEVKDGEGSEIVVDYVLRGPAFSKAGVGIAALLDREGEEWVDDLGLDDRTKRAILHRGREERRWDAQWA